MIPLLPFIAGLVAGAAALSALRTDRAKTALNQTGIRLRAAASEVESSVRTVAQSGLSKLRSAPVAEAPAKAAKPARTRKPATKTAATTATTKPAAKPTPKTAKTATKVTKAAS